MRKTVVATAGGMAEQSLTLETIVKLKTATHETQTSKNTGQRGTPRVFAPTVPAGQKITLKMTFRTAYGRAKENQVLLGGMNTKRHRGNFKERTAD